MPVFLEDILSSFIPQFNAGISEFEIISILKQAPYCLFDEDALREPLMLFQTHFVLFHALYNLRKQWRKQKVGELNIGPTIIKLEAYREFAANLTVADPLADYYLDWQNFAQATQTEVEQLIAGFWQTMAGQQGFYQDNDDDIQNALLTLNISKLEGLSLSKLKLQYHKLQHNNHPDKGGNTQKSQAISHAYAILRKYTVN